MYHFTSVKRHNKEALKSFARETHGLLKDHGFVVVDEVHPDVGARIGVKLTGEDLEINQDGNLMVSLQYIKDTSDVVGPLSVLPDLLCHVHGTFRLDKDNRLDRTQVEVILQWSGDEGYVGIDRATRTLAATVGSAFKVAAAAFNKDLDKLRA